MTCTKRRRRRPATVLCCVAVAGLLASRGVATEPAAPAPAAPAPAAPAPAAPAPAAPAPAAPTKQGDALAAKAGVRIEDPNAHLTDHPGYRTLVDTAYIPADLNERVAERLWSVWPEPLRKQAAEADQARRRQLTFSRYGLTGRPDDPMKPLQYVVTEGGDWVMNCFACHGGKVAGQVILGLPNSHYALQSLTDDVRLVKPLLGQPLGSKEIASLLMPLGTTHGTTNAVNFGVALMHQRDAQLNYVPPRSLPKMVHHDMDAPPWWHFPKRQRLYIDAFAAKDHRALMQFMLVKENGPEKFAAWEAEFRDVYAFLMALRPPKYPFAVDRGLADRGRALFEASCSRCHGSYGEQPRYAEVVVPLDELGTDPVRLRALNEGHRRGYHASWFGHFGKKQTVFEPGGYAAPPLDGVWASAPYFHNGSVPTLWHVLFPDERPQIWRRSEDGYDRERVGLEVEPLATIPAGDRWGHQRRSYFDTRRPGKSAAGHEFPAALTRDERRAVLEYLKTL